jgi:quercetin dioxygenase-like cupin family protein
MMEIRQKNLEGETVPSANEASPDVYKVLLANEHVKMLEMRLEPGQIDNWHMHPSESVYFVKGGNLKIHLPDGSSVSKEVQDGGVMWHEEWTHRVENTGSTTVVAIIVEDIGRKG